MKKIIFSLFFFSVLAISANAQKAACSKTCTTKSAASCQAKAPSVAAVNATETETSMAAAKMASLDPSIETRTCPVTGAVSYVRKETCHSGTVSYVDVSYDAATSTFVNVAPSKMETTGKATSAKTGCASGAAAGKGCCAGKKAATTTTASTEKVKS